MRSGTRGRKRDVLHGVGLFAASAVACTLIAACSTSGGTAAAPSGSTAQAKTAAMLLSTEQGASSVFSADQLQPPVDFCTNLVTQYGGTVTSGLVNGTSVTIPSFTAPSTFGYDSKATALKGLEQSKRLYGDAISTALPLTKVGNKWVFTMNAVEASICTQPDYAAQIIRGLSNIEIGGITVAYLNKWMTQGSPSPLQPVKWAEQCMNGGFAIQAKCAQIMQDAAYMMTKFKPMGVHKDSPSWYFRLRNGLVVGSIPPIESVMGTYTGYFVEFEYTTKVGGCFIKLGVNVGRSKPNGGDKRLAGFLCNQPQAPSTVVPTTQPASSPPVSHRPTPTPSLTQSHPTPTPSMTTPSKAPPSSSPPTSASPSSPPPSTYSPPPSSPPATQTPTAPPTSECPCHSSPPASPTYTPSATPSESYSSPPATDTPSDTATPTDTPSPQCTCMDTVAQVQAEALSLGFNNVFNYGAYPPVGTKMEVALAS